jgi:hypothetical protein
VAKQLSLCSAAAFLLLLWLLLLLPLLLTKFTVSAAAHPVAI